MKIKCPLCRLNEFKDLEFDGYDAVEEHCIRWHTSRTLAASFIENYFKIKKLKEKIHEKINFYDTIYPDDKIGLMKMIQELKSLLENEK